MSESSIPEYLACLEELQSAFPLLFFNFYQDFPLTKSQTL